MALSNAVVTFDLADMLGTDFNPARVRISVTTNVPGNTVIDTDGNKIRLGDGVVTLNPDGTGSFTTWVPGASANPTTWQTTVTVDYPRSAGRVREVRPFGPFTITGTSRTVTNKALTSNVATVTTSVAHQLVVGNTVTVAISDAVFDGTYVITAVPSPTTLSYAKTNANVATAAATGTLTSPNVDLADLVAEQEIPPVYLTTVTTLLDSKVTAAAASATAAAASAASASALATSDGQTATNVTSGTLTRAALNDSFVGRWQALTAYTAGQTVLNPSGAIVSANATFTSGASYNAANWTPVLDTTYAGVWKATTVVTAGTLVLAPNGPVIQRIAGGTTRASYDATEQALWTPVLDGTYAARMNTVSKTSAYTVGALEFVEADASTSAFTVTGPGAGAARWGVEKVNGTSTASGNKVTISYLNSAGTATTIDLLLAGESKVFRPAASGLGYRIESGDTPKAGLAVLVARNARDAGFDTTGTTAISISTMSQFLVDCQNNQREAYFPRGTYKTAQVLVPYGVKISGAGIGGYAATDPDSGTRFLQTAGANKSMFVFELSGTGTTQIGPNTLQDFAVVGDVTNTVGHGIAFTSVTGAAGQFKTP